MCGSVLVRMMMKKLRTASDVKAWLFSLRNNRKLSNIYQIKTIMDIIHEKCFHSALNKMHHNFKLFFTLEFAFEGSKVMML